MFLPCFVGSVKYKNEVNFYACFITNLLQLVVYTDCIILGDFNFEFDTSRYGYIILNLYFTSLVCLNVMVLIMQSIVMKVWVILHILIFHYFVWYLECNAVCQCFRQCC